MAAIEPAAAENESVVNAILQAHGAFCYACGQPIDARAELCTKCGVRQHGAPRSRKSRLAAALFALFLGGFGIHKFYLGRVGQGILYLVFFWTLIPALIALVEAIIYLCTSDEDFAAKYS